MGSSLKNCGPFPVPSQVCEYMEHDLTGLLEGGQVDLTPDQARHLTRQLLEGLAHCHRQDILHRDIKGSNILINNKGQLKIADWGLGRTYLRDEKRPYTNRVRVPPAANT